MSTVLIDQISDAEPPQAIAAESQLLAGMLACDEAVRSRILATVKPQDFYLAPHRHMAAAIAAIHEAALPVDEVTVATWLADRSLLERVGGATAIAEIASDGNGSTILERYADIVAEKSNRRKLIATAGAIAKLALDQRQDFPSLVRQAGEHLGALRSVTSDPTGLQAIEVSALGGFSFVGSAQTEAGRSRVLPTGLYDLDEMLSGGVRRGELIIVAARPSMGKTAFLLQLAQQSAARGLPVAIFEMEMERSSLFYRRLCATTGIEFERLWCGRLSDHEWAGVGEAIEAISLLPIAINDAPNPSVSEIRDQCKALKDQKGPLGGIFIDYFQLMGSGSDNRVQELSKITRSLKQLARDLDTPIFLLSQLSREVEKRNEKRPIMSDIRESGSGEQDADGVWMLYRDEYYNPETPDRGILEILVRKQRNGPTGTVRCLFEPHYGRFKSLTRPRNS